MDKSLKDRILLIKKNRSIACVNFYNDGTHSEDEYSSIKRMETINTPYVVSDLEDIMCDACEYYVYHYDFDQVGMGLLLGLVYKKEDVDDEYNIKENAKPLNDIVRYYTGNVSSYLDGEQTNETTYRGYGRQGYIKYNDFVTLLSRKGLNYNGPKSFKELKDAILLKEPFDINVSVDLKEKDKTRRLIR